jgi:hypothetical protein
VFILTCRFPWSANDYQGHTGISDSAVCPNFVYFQRRCDSTAVDFKIQILLMISCTDGHTAERILAVDNNINNNNNNIPLPLCTLLIQMLLWIFSPSSGSKSYLLRPLMTPLFDSWTIP